MSEAEKIIYGKAKFYEILRKILITCRFNKIENIFYEVETYESYFDKRRERKR